MKKRTPLSNIDVKKSDRIGIRVDERERTIIENNARTWGMNVSQAARRMMFQKNTQSAVSEYDVRKSARDACMALADGMPRALTEIEKAVATYSRSLRITRSDGEPAVNSEYTCRHLDSLTQEVKELGALTEAAMETFGKVPFKSRGRLNRHGGDEQSAIVIGTLSSDAETVQRTSGVYIYFDVSVSYVSQIGEEVSTTYRIWSRYDPLVTAFRKGDRVRVEGTMSLWRDSDSTVKFAIWQSRVIKLMAGR